MRLYFEVAKRSFRQTLTYRAATLAGIFTNSVFGVFIATIYIAFYKSTEGGDQVSVAGWTVSQAVTMSWISQAIIMVIFIWGWWEISLSIQSGAVVSDMVKPMNYFGYWLSRDLGRAFAQLFLRCWPTFLVGAVLFNLEAPASYGRAFAFPVSLVLATVLSFCWRFIINIWTFWTLDHRGIVALSMTLINILSGFLIPLSFFPPGLRQIAELLFFRGIIQMPSEIWLGQSSVLSGLLFQAIWLVILTGFSLWLFGCASRKVAIQGG